MDTILSNTVLQVGEHLGQAASSAASYFPEGWSQAIRHAASYVPSQVDLVSAGLFLMYFTLGSLILGVLGRVVLGKRSSLNRSLSCAIGILFIYVATVVVYVFRPWNLQELLSPLPFVTFTGDYLIVFPIADARFPALCTEVLSLVILAFLVNLLDAFLPWGKNPVSWCLMRLFTVAAAMGLHLAARWAMNTYLPGVLVAYAPTILLVILAFLLLSGVLNLILGLVLTMTNPFLGAMYTFFFSNIVGKQLSKAVFSSAILCAVVYLLGRFGYTIIFIGAGALAAYVPLVLVLALLWYLIGRVL